jgi:hypothetical protein
MNNSKPIMNTSFYEYHSKLSWYLSETLSSELEQVYTIRNRKWLDQKDHIQAFLDRRSSDYYSPFFSQWGPGYILIDSSICKQFSKDFINQEKEKNNDALPLLLLEFSATQIVKHILEFEHDPVSNYLNVDSRIHVETTGEIKLLKINYNLFQLECMHQGPDQDHHIGFIYCLWPQGKEAEDVSDAKGITNE